MGGVSIKNYYPILGLHDLVSYIIIVAMKLSTKVAIALHGRKFEAGIQASNQLYHTLQGGFQ